MTRKTGIFMLMLCVGAFLPGACGFTPLYSSRLVDERTAAVNVLPIDGFLGQSLRSQLEQRFNPGGANTQKIYSLKVTVTEREVSAQAIRRDETATRFTIEMRADYTLGSGERILLRDSAVFRGAYNILEDPYASHASHEDARDRLKDLLADEIAARVALFLKDL